jgi:hypothetical protein
MAASSFVIYQTTVLYIYTEPADVHKDPVQAARLLLEFGGHNSQSQYTATCYSNGFGYFVLMPLEELNHAGQFEYPRKQIEYEAGKVDEVHILE